MLGKIKIKIRNYIFTVFWSGFAVYWIIMTEFPLSLFIGGLYVLLAIMAFKGEQDSVIRKRLKYTKNAQAFAHYVWALPSVCVETTKEPT